MDDVERTHDELSELLGVYALDAVDDEEREAVEAHLAECPRCAAEVADHREVAAAMAFSGAPAPDGVWSRIVDSLEEPPPELDLQLVGGGPAAVPEQSAAVTPLRPSRRPRLLAPLGIAAGVAVLVLGLLAGVLIGQRDDGPSDAEVAAAATLEDVARRVLNDAEADKFELRSESGELTATAAVEPDGSGYLLGTSLPALDPTLTYQLWGVRGDVVLSLGVLGDSPGVVAFHLDEGVDALVITSEVAGGVPVSSNPPLLVGTVS